MNRNAIIERTLDYLKLMPPSKAKEVLDFVEYLYSKAEADVLTRGIEVLASSSKSFSFLAEEEELYSEKDIIE